MAESVAALRARFEAANGNLAVLQALLEDLRGRTEPAAVDLLCDVMAALQTARAGSAKTKDGSMGQGSADLVDRIRARGTSGDPLYRYGVTDDEYAALRAQLDYLHERGGLEQANDRSAAAFVLYVAEWYRRDYEGGSYSWEAPYPALIGALTDAARKALARRGLAWWGREARRTQHAEMRLMSLVMEGGFPTRLLETREGGRIALHLTHLLAKVEAAGTTDEERAVEFSRSIGGQLGMFNHEEFHILCAELVLSIAGLKAEAAAGAPAGIAATAWLDAAREGWRDSLPISLSGDGARRLIDDMVSARAIRLGGGDARAWRLLMFEDGQWKPGVRLGMDGEISLAQTQFRASDGRLRVHAAGALTSTFAGELGLIEAPTEEAQGWLCRPRGGRGLRAPFPFSAVVEVELRAGATSQTIAWPQGDALRSEVLLFADDSAVDDRPLSRELALVGRGSMRTRRPRLACLAPNDFVARGLDSDTQIEPIWRGPDVCLFDLAAPARIGPPGGDHYRIEVGADSERAEQLVLDGVLARGLESANAALSLYAGTPALRVRRGAGRAMAPPAGEVRWRSVGESIWRDWLAKPPTHGAIEVVWRDPNAQAVRDRQRFIVLPKGLKIETRPAGRQHVAVILEAPAGWVLQAAPDAALEATTTNQGLDINFTGRPLRRLPLLLEGPGFEAQPLLARARIGAGGFFRADGRMFDQRASVMLDDLRGAVAYSEGLAWLYLSLPQRGESRLKFTDETPLWGLSEEITRLLSGGDDLDDKVIIEFGADGQRLSVGRYDITLRKVVDGMVEVESDHSGAAGASTRRLEWFSILEPGFRPIADGEGPARLPDVCRGPGVALLRDGERVVGRPTLALGSAVSNGEWGALQAASTIGNHADRAQAIGQAIAGLGRTTPEAGQDRDYLRALISNLGGLPPSSFDVLKALTAAPAALAALIATTNDEAARQAIWALERDLPFLWCMIPIATWAQAFDLQRATLGALLVQLPAAQAAAIVETSVASTAQTLADLDPTLSMSLGYAGVLSQLKTQPSLPASANDRITRIGHLIDDTDPRVRTPQTDPAAASCFRAADSEVASRLPTYRFMPVHWEGLDAPCAAALAAAGEGWLSPRQIRRVRQARAEEPLSFADMFAAALHSRARGEALTC